MRFGRKKDEPADEATQAADQTSVNTHLTREQVETGRSNGPWDSREVDAEAIASDSVNLGSLLLKGRQGLELRMQIDEASQAPVAAIVVAEDGAVELRPFAASRGPEFWDEVRASIAAQVSQQGGEVAESNGPWGPELHANVQAVDAEGRTVFQPSRVVGIRGPRWLLRATFFGALADAPNPDHLLEQVVRDIVVVRPEGAMPPGEALALRLPPSATA